MSQQKFQVIINGQLTEGAKLEQTKLNIAKLFKASPDAIAPMFSGKRLSVKKNLDQETAKKYKIAIIKAGLKAGIAPMAAVGNAVTKPTQAAQPSGGTETQTATGALGNATIAAAGSTIDDTPPPATPEIDTSGYGMDEVGITLDNTPPPEAPEIDTSSYGMEEVGIILDETPPPDEPDIDISGFDMEEVGITLDETPPPATPEIDVGDISMKEVGVDLMEYEPVPEAEFDLSQLSMSEPGAILTK